MARTQSVVSLDAIDVNNKRNNSAFSRLLKTRRHKGKPAKKTDSFGHYIFCGRQRSGKTVSALWFTEYLSKKYTKQKKQILFYSNLDFGVKLTKFTISNLIRQVEYDPNTIHIFIVDEIHGYFPKDSSDKTTKLEIDKLTQDFSQLAKKQIYVLSTAQVYGRINKSIREQCLYMVNCKLSLFTNKIVNDFIDGDDILCDELGRWSGNPKFIHVHGLPKIEFNTHKMITD